MYIKHNESFFTSLQALVDTPTNYNAVYNKLRLYYLIENNKNFVLALA